MGDYDKIFLDEMTIVFTFKDNPFLPLLNHDLTKIYKELSSN